MVRWLRCHCPPDTGFEIRALAVWGRARYLSVTEAPHNYIITTEWRRLAEFPTSSPDTILVWFTGKLLHMSDQHCIDQTTNVGPTFLVKQQILDQHSWSKHNKHWTSIAALTTHVGPTARVKQQMLYQRQTINIGPTLSVQHSGNILVVPGSRPLTNGHRARLLAEQVRFHETR